MKQIPVVENVLKLNDQMAQQNRQSLEAAGVFTVDLIGGPGSGKTALLEQTLRRLGDQMAIGVLAGDLATARDGERLSQWSGDIVQINTGRSCHLDANQVRQGMEQLDLGSLDVLVVENVGNLICPVGFDLGQNVKVGLFSVSEGDDKAAKHPHLVSAADVIVLNKIDLIGKVNFDRDAFEADIRSIQPEVLLLEVSATEDRIDPWLRWLSEQTEAAKTASA